VPAIGQLRGVFGILTAALGVISLILWNHASHLHLDGFRYAAPGLAGAVLFSALFLLAPKLPLATGVIGLSLVAGEWIRLAIISPFAAIDPGISLVFRFLAVSALLFAVRAGYRARCIRHDADEAIPKATAKA
jgi:hypothetical protein